MTDTRFVAKFALVDFDQNVWLTFDSPREFVQRLKAIAKAKGKRAPKKIDRILLIAERPTH